jgi:hypothetical protein
VALPVRGLHLGQRGAEMNIWQILALVVGLGVIGVAMYNTPRDPKVFKKKHQL